jgi:hypothetical protein
MWTTGETKGFGAKDRVYVTDMPEHVSVVRTPAMSPELVPFGSLRDVVFWLGYCSAFCLFARLGWLMALLGAGCVAASACRGEHRFDFTVMRVACSRCARSSLALLVATALPAGFCALQIERARSAAERGEFALALGRLEWARTLVPLLRTNGDVVDQIGLLHARLGLQTPESMLHSSQVLIRHGRFDEGEGPLVSMEDDPALPLTVRLEAARALLRRGIRQLNAGATAASIATIESVLRSDPGNIKANYALEIAYLRTGRFESVAPLAGQMRKVYHSINTITKPPVLAAVEENVAYAAYFAGDVAAAHAARQLLGDPKALTKEP